jgi:UDP-N-acetylmuramate--alanine ligase
MNIVKAARKAGHEEVEYVKDKDDVPEILLDCLRPGDAVLFLGAGDIGRVSVQMVELLKRGKRAS